MARCNRVASLVMALGLAAAADGQVNWVTQMQFAASDGPALAGNTFAVTATGTYTFTVRVGIFGLTGLGPLQGNFGVNNWTANLAASGVQPGESLGVTPTGSRVSPFSFGPATTFGGTLLAPGTITNVNAARDVSGGAVAPWLWDTGGGQPAPMPTLPTNPSPGAESYTNVWRFTVSVNSLSGQDLVVIFTGQAGPVVQWATFGTPPTPTLEVPSEVSFIGLTPTPVLRNYTPTSLILHRVPAPGAPAAALLGAALVGLRRRRGGLHNVPTGSNP